MGLFGGHVFFKPNLQRFQGGFVINLAGFDGCAYRITILIQYPIDQAPALVGAGFFAAPVGPNIVLSQYRIEFG